MSVVVNFEAANLLKFDNFWRFTKENLMYLNKEL